MKAELTIKEQLLLNKLNRKISKLSQIMLSQGLSAQDVQEFVYKCVFDIDGVNTQILPKLSKDFSSETQQQTNSEASQSSKLSLQMGLEKAIFQKISEGVKVQKILLRYFEKCCFQEQKLKNYLISEEVVQSPKQGHLQFERFRQKISQAKFRRNKFETDSLFQEQSVSPKLRQIIQTKQRIKEAKERSILQESRKELEQMRSFEKSLSQSIRKTRMLRSILQKQLQAEFSPLTLLTNNSQDCAEIY